MTTIVEYDFSVMSESDIREEIIAPILRALGYQSGTPNNIMREREIRLRYEHIFLGRKKKGKDLTLIGRPDYICEARGITRWALEAKPPSVDISRDDIEQAHTYAFHSDIAAPIFVLCNGRDWQVFETNRGPAATPILRLTHIDVQERFYQIANLLTPESLNRRYPVRGIDLGRPLGKGLGSRARIVGGFTRYNAIECFYEGLPPQIQEPDMSHMQRLVGIQVALTGDSCWRDEEHGIVADIRAQHLHVGMEQFSLQFGTNVLRYTTREAQISNDKSAPTIFECTRHIDVPAKTSAFDWLNNGYSETPIALRLSWYSETTGFLDDAVFKGTYDVRFVGQPIGFDVRHLTFLNGSFEVKLEA